MTLPGSARVRVTLCDRDGESAEVSTCTWEEFRDTETTDLAEIEAALLDAESDHMYSGGGGPDPLFSVEWIANISPATSNGTERCESCGMGDAINPDCPTCHGEGDII